MEEEVDKKLVTVTYKLALLCPDFDINESFCITFVSQVTFAHLFCVGDTIVYINGISPKNRKDALHAMQKRGIEITVTVLRHAYMDPLSLQRAKAIGLKRRKGCHYFVANIRLTSDKESLGLIVRKVGERIFVSKVLDRGIMVNILRPGDAILDVDERKVVNDAFLKKTLIETLLTKKSCSIVVERADYGKITKRSTTLSLLSQFQTEVTKDPTMPKDAAEIGMKQSQYYRENCSRTIVFPLAAGAILKSSSRRSGISGTTSKSSQKKKSQEDKIILQPNFTKEIKMKMMKMGSSQASQASTCSINAAESTKHVKFKKPIEFAMTIPSDYSNKILQKVRKDSRSKSSSSSMSNITPVYVKR